MHLSIIKFQLVGNKHQSLTLPLGGKIISVGLSDGRIAIWAEVNREEHRTETRHIEIWSDGGGPMAPVRRQFLGTVHVSWFVFHVYENKEPHYVAQPAR